MLIGFVVGIVAAWGLSLFGVHEMLFEALAPWVDAAYLTMSYYYVVFGLLGMLGGVFSR